MEISLEEVINIFTVAANTFQGDLVLMTEEEFKTQFDLENCPCCRRDYLEHLVSKK